VEVNLKIEVFDKEKRLISSISKEEDLVTKNFHRIFAGTISKRADNRSLPSPLGLIIASDGSISFIRFKTSDPNIFYTSGTSGYLIEIGNGTRTPSIDDSRLESTITSGNPTTISLTLHDTGEVTVTYIREFTFAAETTVSECGLFFQIGCTIDGSSTSRWIMLARDTFTPVTVPAGGSITIDYIITI